MKNLLSRLLRGLQVQGVTPYDKFLLFLVKIIYISSRILLWITLRKERRSKFYTEHELNFGILCNKLFSIFKYNQGRSTKLLKFKMTKYNFEFYCRNNKDDFVNMTLREEDIVQRFQPKKGDSVIDIGAHIGHYTIIASKRVGLNGQVVAIEADPNNFEMLNRNIELNKLTNVIALNYAVYSRPAKIKLYLAGQESGHTIYSTVMSDRAQSEEKFVDVEANTLDLLLQSNGIKQEDVNWIKIDVEGAEYEVLKGATNILSKSKDISLLIEIHNLSLGMNQYKPISEFLNSYHFKIDYEKTYEGGERHIIARKN
jgi:FkbM family methyltransferase